MSFDAVLNIDVAIRVHHPCIAGVEPAVGINGLGGRFGQASSNRPCSRASGCRPRQLRRAALSRFVGIAHFDFPRPGQAFPAERIR